MCILLFMDCLDTYLNMTLSYKDYYIMNNEYLKDGEVSPEELFYNISNDVDIILNRLSISPSKFGYKYWKDAIYITILNNAGCLSICNEIYPTIAKKYHKTPISVERAMRVCFENVLYDNSRREPDFIFCFMKNSLLFPHNSELLAKLTELVVSKEFQKNKSSFKMV